MLKVQDSQMENSVKGYGHICVVLAQSLEKWLHRTVKIASLMLFSIIHTKQLLK